MQSRAKIIIGNEKKNGIVTASEKIKGLTPKYRDRFGRLISGDTLT